MITLLDKAFPKLTDEEIELLSPLSSCEEYNNGDYVLRAGDAGGDLIVVKSGHLDIINPIDNKQKS